MFSYLDLFSVLKANNPQTSSEIAALVESAPIAIPAECAADEALTQTSPLYYQRNNITALIRKHQNDIKLELMNPVDLKGRYSDDKAALVKQHKIQVGEL